MSRRSSGKRRSTRWVGSVVLALFLLVLLFVVSIFAWPAIDARTLKGEECQVDHAVAQTGAAGYRTGPGSPVVVISTTNCGTLLWSDGVTQENKDTTASGFTPGEKYLFTSGWYSRVIMRDLLHRPAEVATFSRIEDSE